MDFDDLKDYVKINYELTQDGLVISKGKLSEVSAAPHSEGKIDPVSYTHLRAHET